MKTILGKSRWMAPGAGLLALVFSAQLAAGADLTAFQLVKEGNRYIGEQSKNKVVQIRSEKSAGKLAPDIWYIVYYDPDAALKAIEVKFGAGKKLDVNRPLRLLEPITGDDRILDPSRLKVDSDRAIESATGDPMLKGMTVKATQLWLNHGDTGPTWKVKLWAARLKTPEESADVGDVYVSCEDGTIVKTDLHPDSIH